MSAIPKKKLCWNCEGRVAFSDENCPYCCVYLSSSSLINTHNETTTHIAPFAPYRQGSDKSVPASPYTLDQEEDLESNEDESSLEDSLDEETSGLLPLSLLLAGSIFFMFGLILLLFSRQGTLTLHWNASYWYIYLALAAALIFTGWRSMQNDKN